MKNLLLLITISLGVFMLNSCSNIKNQEEESVYMFSYFVGNGNDGLHFLYSEDGLKWNILNEGKSFLTPEISNDKLMRDPCIVQDENGIFHMVWTVSWTARGIGYAYSADLINWSEQQYIPVMEYEPTTRNSWAPEITYDKDSKLFMIYWSSTIPGLFPETQIEADAGYNHRIYYTTTYDFKEFAETKLLYEPGFNVIDASIVPHDGKFVMFLKDETREPAKKSLHVATADNLTGPYSNASDAITGNYWAEGPTSLFIDNKWIVYFDKYRDKKMGAVTSEDLENWEDISDSVSFPAGTRHGTAFVVKKSILEYIIKTFE